MNYNINKHNLENISEVTNTTKVKLAESIGATVQKLSRKLDGSISMCDLIKMCNTFHIPCSTIIQVEGSADVRDTEGWKNMKLLQDEFVKRIIESGKSMNEIGRIIDCTRNTVYNRIMKSPRLSDIICICNTMQWNIGDIITNCDIKDIYPKYYQSRAAFVELRRQNEHLQRQVEQLKLEVASLKAQLGQTT